MAEKKTTEKIEKEYVIPLRDKCRPVPRWRKTPKAVKTVKEFLARHMKIRDRDLNKIRLDKYLNEYLWGRGIKNPPHKVKVKAFIDGENVRVELAEYPEKLKFKKAREEKREAKASENKKQKAPKEEEKTESKEEERKEIIEEEKKAAVIEAGEKMEKAAAQASKHLAKDKSQKSRGQQRKVLAK